MSSETRDSEKIIQSDIGAIEKSTSDLNNATIKAIENIRLSVEFLMQKQAQLEMECSTMKTKYLELVCKYDKLLLKDSESRVMAHFPILPGIDPVNQARNFCSNLVAGIDSHIECVRTIGYQNNGVHDVLIKFKSSSTALNLLMASKSLKRSRVHIYRDYPKPICVKRENLAGLRAAISRKYPGERMYLKDDVLIIRRMKFKWCNYRGLRYCNDNGFDLLEKIFNDPEICSLFDNIFITETSDSEGN